MIFVLTTNYTIRAFILKKSFDCLKKLQYLANAASVKESDLEFLAQHNRYLR